MNIHSLTRSFRRAPMFALVVTVLVASVVAINASTFAAIDALRWKALPYVDGNRLLEMRGDMQKFGFMVGLNARIRDALNADRIHFDGAAGFVGTGSERIDANGQRWRLAEVTPGFERVLGAVPSMGRSIAGGDASKGADNVVVISDHAWRARFNADPNMIGRVVDFGNTKLTVIGVMPPDFAFPDTRVDAWRPYVAGDDSRSFGALEVVARVVPGTSVAQARELLASLIANDKPLTELVSTAGIKANVRPWRERYSAGHERALELLQLAALVLLVVTIANLINLNLDHLMMRHREFGIRRALGASEKSITWNVAADVLPPALIGLLLGLLVTPLGLRVIAERGLLPDDLPQGASFGAAAIISGCVAMVLITLTVLFAAWGAQCRQGLSSRGFAGMGRLRPSLLIGQVMLTTILLGGSMLLLRSAINLVSSDRSFVDDGVVMTMIDPLGVSVDNAQFHPENDSEKLRASFGRIRDAIATLPGVDHVALASAPPFSQSEMVATIRVPGLPEIQNARMRLVTPDYFKTLGIRLDAGREFSPNDAGDASPVVVDELYRQRFLHGVSPLDAHVDISTQGDNTRKARIIGVARSVKHDALDEESGLPTIYQFTQAPLPVAFLLTHGAGDPRRLAQTVRQRVLATQPGTVIISNKPLSDSIAETLAPRRSLLETIAGFGLATLLLASIGLAAVLSFSIRHRTAEFGVRLAVGATPLRVRNMILRQGTIIVTLGGLLGVVVGLPLARLLGDRLYQIRFNDAASWLATLACVMLVAFLACWLPARRASRLSPTQALRHE